MKVLFSTNFSRNFWKITCINIIQFLFQIFTLFNPISNILGPCKLNFILCNSTPLSILLSQDITQNMSRSNESWRWRNNFVWILKMMVDKTGELQKSSHPQMFLGDKVAVLRAPTKVFSCEFCKIFKSSFLIEHLRWLLLNTAINRRYFEKELLQNSKDNMLNNSIDVKVYALQLKQKSTRGFSWNFAKF